jgi:hypothetical protein
MSLESDESSDVSTVYSWSASSEISMNRWLMLVSSGIVNEQHRI